MPILNKFRLRSPVQEFENYLGEEMNTFAGFYNEESLVQKEKETTIAIENPAMPQDVSPAPQSRLSGFWSKIKAFFNSFITSLFSGNNTKTLR